MSQSSRVLKAVWIYSNRSLFVSWRVNGACGLWITACALLRNRI